MANFDTAYNLERKHEGFYSNESSDKGGETYAGIARNIHPTWTGWQIVDQYKASINRPLKRNEIIRDLRLEPLVREFYLSIWTAKNFGKIKDQNTANILYDWFINSGTLAINSQKYNTGVKRILINQFSKNIAPLNSTLDLDTVKLINSVDSIKLYNAIKKERINFYQNLVNENPSQSVFLKGWLNRINSFKDLTPLKITGGIVVIILIILILYHYNL